jgi:hypothetical protein
VKPKRPTPRELFIEKAESQIGYTARLSRENMYGERLGLNGQPWDGLFIDWVAREVGLPLHPHVFTTVALGHYVTDGRLHGLPKRGDVVFFQTSTVSDFGSPHVGIVTDTKRFSLDGTFECVEAMIDSGQPKGGVDVNGVFKRVRHKLDVVGFGRPKFRAQNQVARLREITDMPTDRLLRVSPAQVKPGIRHKHVEVVQLALASTTGVRGLPRGHFDGRTRASFSSFQRSLGIPASRANGIPDFASLDALGKKTNLFVASQ